MARTDITKEQIRYGIVLQDTWGTAELASVNYNSANNGCELSCDPTNIDNDVKVEELGGIHGTRRATDDSFIHHTNGAMPKVTITGIVRLNEIDLLLAAFFQTVSEGATTPYAKTFTQASGQPADFTAGAGFFLTFAENIPGSANGQRLKDCVASDLKLSIPNNGLVTYEVTLVGRGAVDDEQTFSGTWAVSAADVLHHKDIAAFEYGGTATKILTSAELTFHHDIIGIGHDGGDHETFAITGAKYEFSLVIFDDGGDRATYNTHVAQGVASTFRIGWGNATPGTAENDFDIAWRGALTAPPSQTHDAPESLTVSGRMVAASGGASSPITIICANAIDRAF